MRILHTSDWHLGHRFYRHHRGVEMRHFLRALIEMLEHESPDALLVSGDIFDTPNPSAEAQELFFDFLDRAQQVLPDLQIVVTAGNHDSGARLESPRALLERRKIYLRGVVEHDADGQPLYDDLIIPLRSRQTQNVEALCLAVPFLRPSDYGIEYGVEEGLAHFVERLKKTARHGAYKRLPLVACAHYYALNAHIDPEQHSERLIVGGQDAVKGNIWGKDMAYVALGHIHREQQVQEGVYYAGSAMPMSFAEKNYRHGAWCVDIDAKGKSEVRFINYEPLRRLISVPKSAAALPERVFAELTELPERGEKEEGDNWSYLEVKVIEEQPEPELLHHIQQLVEQKAVYLCRVVRERHRGKDIHGGESLCRVDGTLKLSPEELAMQYFHRKYGQEMSEALSERLGEAITAAAQGSV